MPGYVNKPYAVIWFLDPPHDYRFCFDRGYHYLGRDVTLSNKICIKDIMPHELDINWFHQKQFPGWGEVPELALTLFNEGRRFIVYFTNFYEI